MFTKTDHILGHETETESMHGTFSIYSMITLEINIRRDLENPESNQLIGLNACIEKKKGVNHDSSFH